MKKLFPPPREFKKKLIGKRKCPCSLYYILIKTKIPETSLGEGETIQHKPSLQLKPVVRSRRTPGSQAFGLETSRDSGGFSNPAPGMEACACFYGTR